MDGVTSLPLALSRWETELAAFPRDLAITLGPWLGRLAAAIGPRSIAADVSGEPDGLGSIGRRGPYERLLASEWLLATEMPDEFVRRAAEHEHLFLERTYAARRARRSALVLFDAGPSQLGAPRIAHVALLAVLHRRARAVDARLAWGILQRPDQPTRDGVDAATFRALLDARTDEEVDAMRVDGWRARAKDADTWIVGGAVANALGEPIARGLVQVEDPIALDRDALDVRIRQERRTVTVELRLPDDATATRLVRDPFATPRLARPVEPSHAAAPRDGRLALPGDGRRLVVADTRGFTSWALPQSGGPRKLVGGRDQLLLAVGHRGRKLFGVFVPPGRGRLILHRPPFASADGRPITFRDPAELHRGDLARGERPLGIAVAHVLSPDPNDPDLTFDDGRGHLLTFRRSAPERVHVHEGVLAWAPLHDGAALVQRDGSATKLVVLEREGAVREVTRLEVASTRAWLGSDGVRAVAGVALDATERHVVLLPFASLAPRELVAPEGTRVVGVHAFPEEGPALVFVDRDARSVGVISKSGVRVLFKAVDPIADACSATRLGNVAWRTESGWVEVGSVVAGAKLLAIPPGEERR